MQVVEAVNATYPRLLLDMKNVWLRRLTGDDGDDSGDVTVPVVEGGDDFAAEGYARASGKPGVCIATSGPGAANLVSGLADVLLDSVPLVAITGQVPRRMIGTDAFQETPIIEVTRSITEHNYLVLDVEDIPRVVSEAFYLARTGRPDPVLIDVPNDIQQRLVVPKWDEPMRSRNENGVVGVKVGSQRGGDGDGDGVGSVRSSNEVVIVMVSD
ncbi:acetolactate synthase 1 [Artemisia annua]|uniref:Acetolactate synthase 1 n=1 Tax=Artemisia annua TaxID=35608 RepID=A0A2U1N299_ARTAN|nr:acetolactate synthase 1 [Artemisia annua]